MFLFTPTNARGHKKRSWLPHRARPRASSPASARPDGRRAHRSSWCTSSGHKTFTTCLDSRRGKAYSLAPRRWLSMRSPSTRLRRRRDPCPRCWLWATPRRYRPKEAKQRSSASSNFCARIRSPASSLTRPQHLMWATPRSKSSNGWHDLRCARRRSSRTTGTA